MWDYIHYLVTEFIVTKEQMKMLGYFDRLDAKDQDLVLEILQKSLRINRLLWSAQCYELLKSLEKIEKEGIVTIDLFNNNHYDE